MICAAICAMGLSLPAPPNPWTTAQWSEMTRNSLWSVSGPLPPDRCIIEIGDDAWQGGKAASPRMCDGMDAGAHVAVLRGYVTSEGVGLLFPPLGPEPPTIVTAAPGGAAWTPPAPATIGGHIVTDYPRDPSPVVSAPPVSPVPLPASLGMLLAALFGLIGWRAAR